ncbi:MAG: ThuA domain-containing protein [Verrucomicrobiota bacterium]
MTPTRRIIFSVLAGLLLLAADVPAKSSPKVLFIAGPGSHGYGAHEFRAGALLLANELDASNLKIETAVSEYGWPKDDAAFDGVTSVVMLCTGEDAHLLNDHLDFFDKLADKGVGLVLIHTSTITTIGPPGEHFMKWVGGYHELYYSVVHTWEATFDSLPEHPITRGVKPFVFDDEWYFHMRFRPGLENITPILSAHPKRDDVMNLKSGKLKGDDQVKDAVARGEIQHVAWAFERPDGGRGFGFTGAHNHWSWADTNYRKLVLNAIVWTTHGEVPEDGVPSAPLTLNQLLAHQDYNPKVGMTLDDVLAAIPAPLADSNEEPNFQPRTLLTWNDDAPPGTTRIAFLAGSRSGEYGTLESYAASVLLGRELEAAFPNLDVAVFARPFPKEIWDELTHADAVVFHTEEGSPNPLDKGPKPVAELIASGIGAVALTGSLVANPGNGELLLETIGARATSPAQFKDRRIHFDSLPDHPVCYGVAPFEIEDAWLAHLELADTLTPLLADPDTNAPLLWINETESGNRIVGHAGGFHHFALANQNYRRLLLNAIAWAAGLNIPEQGTPAETLSLNSLKQNQNHRPPGNINWNEYRGRFGITD